MTTLLHLLRTHALAIAVLAIVMAAVAWRIGHPMGSQHATGHAPSPMQVHSIAGAQVLAPSGWRSLDRTRDHATWGDVDRAHTVTLGSIAQGEGSIAAVVHAIAEDAEGVAPGAAVVGAPELLDLPKAPRGDTAMLLRLEVPTEGSRPLAVVQVWRRDTRAQLDVVATWTSMDGHWPVDPARSVPNSRVR